MTIESPTDLQVLLNDDEFADCYEYVVYAAENPKATADEIARDCFGISRQALYKRLAKWRASGILGKARIQFMLPSAEAIERASEYVLQRWPEVILAVVEESLSGATHAIRKDARLFLVERVVTPMMDRMPKAGSREGDYLRDEPDFDLTPPGADD